MTKKSILSNQNPGVALFDNNFKHYKTVGFDNDTAGNYKKFKSMRDLSVLSKEETFFEDDYRFDGPDSGIRSTQQINLDYEVFENHVFFDSAVSKINIAFDKIVNEFPFEKTEAKLNEYLQSLTGYERYILNLFGKSLGYLTLSGSAVGENSGGQYIEIKDAAGSLYPTFSTRNDNKPALSPKNNPFTIETYISLPTVANDNQVIFQYKKTEKFGIMLSLSASDDVSKCNIVFDVSSGSNHSYVSSSFDKGKFYHVGAAYSVTNNPGKSLLYIDSVLKATSSMTLELTNFDLSAQDSKAYIGSGSILNTANADTDMSTGVFTPQQTFSGSIDEFRFYHLEKNEKTIKDTMKINVFGGDESKLALYFKFNEPSGSYRLPSVCLDSSGNSLHSNITNFSHEIRNTGSISSPVTEEILSVNPVLYPDFPQNTDLHNRLINSASLYDEKNPNLITNLIPVHYLLEGNDFEGFQNMTGSYGNVYKSQSIPGSGQVGSGQLLMSFLFLWAKYFDELKIYIDTLSRVLSYGYDTNEVGIDKFLPFVGKYYGIDLPGIFTSAMQRQYNKNVGINDLGTVSTLSLRKVQNQIWRRILTNLNALRQSKGTISSVKGMIRTLGIEPDTIFDIREYGGPKAFFLDGRRKNIKKAYKMIDFSGSLASISDIATVDSNTGFNTRTPRIISPFLSGSRIEVGFPEIKTGTATGTVTIGNSATATNLDGKTITITDTAGLEKVYIFDDDNDGATGTLDGSDRVRIQINGMMSTTAGRILMAAQVEAAIENANGHAGSITVSTTNQIVGLTQGSFNVNDGNNTIETSVTDATHLAVSGFSGGFGYLNQPNHNFVHGISNNPNDGLFTSGSFGYDAVYKFETNLRFPLTQSLVRLHMTGSSVSNSARLVTNCVLVSGSRPELKLFVDAATAGANASDTARLQTLTLNSASLFNGNPWYVSFGLIRNDDDIVQDEQYASSSLFLRAISDDEIYYVTSSLDMNYYNGTENYFQNVDSAKNASGSFLIIGSQSIKLDGSSSPVGLSATGYNRIVRSTDFAGKINFIRFWSRGISLEESLERAKNFRSLGVKDPTFQYNHNTLHTGSFNRLRIDAKASIQITTASDSSGEMRLDDFSQNNLHFAGNGFEPDQVILKNEMFLHSMLSPKFDIRSSDMKVRVRSFLEKENLENDDFAKATPVFNLDDEFSPEDDNRFSIDLSAVKALDEDIMKMFSSMQSFDNALGDTRDLFEDSYIELENLRKVYFKDLIQKLNLSSYSEFFTWFDEAFTVLLTGFIPLRANFLGVNYVIESHVLERHKMKYFYDEQYLLTRSETRDRFGNL